MGFTHISSAHLYSALCTKISINYFWIGTHGTCRNLQSRENAINVSLLFLQLKILYIVWVEGECIRIYFIWSMKWNQNTLQLQNKLHRIASTLSFALSLKCIALPTIHQHLLFLSHVLSALWQRTEKEQTNASWHTFQLATTTGWSRALWILFYQFFWRESTLTSDRTTDRTIYLRLWQSAYKAQWHFSATM